MALPPLDEQTGYLPPGEHRASWDEFVEIFGQSYRRRRLIPPLRIVLGALRVRGVSKVWIAGSFVSSSQRPRDVDVVYDPPPHSNPTTWGILAPANRQALRKKRKVDLWRFPSPQPTGDPASPFVSIVEFFSTDYDDNPKGIVVLEGDDLA